MPSDALELWTCERCELIGSAGQLLGHEEASGHAVRKLSAAEDRGVREIWAAEGRDPLGEEFRAAFRGTLLTDTGRALVRGLVGRLGGGGGLDGPDF